MYPIYGVSEDFTKIQTIEMAYGRYINQSEFLRGNPVAIIGFKNAEQLFGDAGHAVGKSMMFNHKKVLIIGVIEKQGSNFADAFEYDQCVILSFRYYASIYDVNGDYSNPFIIVNARQNVPSSALSDELRGVMRQIRKLSPKQEDNFALNDINVLSQQTGPIFATMNIGGWAIAGLSLIVGAFGVANIMFVTVRERTGQIGLKKAVGAKSRTILTEFFTGERFSMYYGWIIRSCISMGPCIGTQ